MVSSPYMSLDMKTELKTCDFQAVSVNIVPKYVACRCRGAKEPSITVGRFNFNVFQDFV